MQHSYVLVLAFFLSLFKKANITKDGGVCGISSLIRWHLNVVIQSRCSFSLRLLLEAVNHAHTEHPYLVKFTLNPHWVAVSSRQRSVVQHGPSLSRGSTVACFMFHVSSFFCKPLYVLT